MKSFKNETAKIFNGVNYALAGANKMGELVSLSSNHLNASPEHDSIFVDLPNAFNECSRVVAARTIVDKCPNLCGIFSLLYENNSKIWLRNNEDEWESVIAEEGCVQGCAMGPFVFGFATLSVYERIANLLSTKSNSFFGAYSDDSMIGAKHDDAVEAFDELKNGLASVGLKINFNPHKAVVMLDKCQSDEEAMRKAQSYRERGFPEENIKVHPFNGGAAKDYGYIHLGIPVGDTQYCRMELEKLVQNFSSVCECDNIVKLAQQKWIYLLWVIRQKVSYWFRHMCPSIVRDTLPHITAVLKKKFSAVANFEVTDVLWRQACLPIKTHGCGLGDPKLTHAAAFVANVEETIQSTRKVLKDAPYLDLLDVSKAVPEDFDFGNESTRSFVLGYRELKESIVNAANDIGEVIDEEKCTVMATKKRLQHFYFYFLTAKSIKTYEDYITRDGSRHDKARTFSNDGSIAGAWLRCVPKKGDRHMDNVTFRTSLMLRLGVPCQERPMQCGCRSRNLVDEHLDHFLCCKKYQGEHKGRHDAVAADIKSLCNHAGLQFTDPKLGELRTVDNDDNKAADGCIRGLHDKPLFVDVTISNPTGPSYLDHRGNGNSWSVRHFAIKLREKVKNDKYLERCRQINSEFVPLAFEVYGAASENVNSFIKSVVSKAAERNGIPYHVLLNYWRKRISCTLQSYNAWIINQAYLQSNNLGGGNLHRDFSLENISLVIIILTGGLTISCVVTC